MSKSPAFQWYPKDILASARVQMMSMTEECAYRRLIDFCWINGSIPADASRAARLVGKGCSVEAAKVALEMFEPHPTDADKMVHDRLETEKEKQAKNSKVRQAAAEARWNKQGTSADARGKQAKSKTDANAMQTDMQNNALHTSSSSSSTAIKKENTTEAVVKKKTPTAPKPTDDEFLVELSENIAYKHINILIEFEKAKVWCKNNNRQPTRKFFISWINRIQPAMETNGANENGAIQKHNGNGFKTTAEKRDERAISEFNAIQAIRNRVAARHTGNLPRNDADSRK